MVAPASQTSMPVELLAVPAPLASVPAPLARRGGGAVPRRRPPARSDRSRGETMTGESKLPSLASRCLTVCYGARRQVLNTRKRVLWGGYKQFWYGDQFCLSASENNVRESLNIFFSFETKKSAQPRAFRPKKWQQNIPNSRMFVVVPLRNPPPL